ncbi:MAG: YscO family type III secretion system apparatus protein [Chromatiaceae bacterium]|nr:YscO family type III secretion system apparatus protein [Chromatiaceae bacterium]MCP5315841.1 YscO family type III secretion system apparatus protein [Chromatiaceae bacterium]
MYEDLLRIKDFREQGASTEVTRRHRTLDERTADAERVRQERETFHVRRLAREKQLFDDLRGRAVGLRELEEMNQRVSAMREHEAEMETRVVEANRQVEQARADLQDARAKHSESVRELEKFREFIKIQNEAERREQARREENEVEEQVSASYRQP